MTATAEKPTETYLTATAVPEGWTFIAEASPTYNPSITKFEECNRVKFEGWTGGREAKMVKAKSIGVRWNHPSGFSYGDDENQYYVLIVKEAAAC